MEKVEQDMKIVASIASFLKQDRNSNHLSEEDLEKTRTAVGELQRRLSKYKKEE
jgi:hypothetical protein